jgi:hypothetical protein
MGLSIAFYFDAATVGVAVGENKVGFGYAEFLLALNRHGTFELHRASGMMLPGIGTGTSVESTVVPDAGFPASPGKFQFQASGGILGKGASKIRLDLFAPAGSGSTYTAESVTKVSGSVASAIEIVGTLTRLHPNDWVGKDRGLLIKLGQQLGFVSGGMMWWSDPTNKGVSYGFPAK